jgi:sugar phosphate isomerase/epimerase
MTKFKLGTNLGFAGNRFTEPEEWARIAREELDVDYIQFSADVMDPLWPEEYVREYLERTRACLQKYALTVDSMFTGYFSRRHLLLHPDEGARRMWFEWYKAYIRSAVEVGAQSVGSHFGTLTVRDTLDESRYAARVREAVRLWQELSVYAKQEGLSFLFFETMSIQREMADTIEGAIALHADLNEGSAIPIRMCLDVGHAPHPSQRDPYLWMEKLGSRAAFVHLQQTEANHSRHWPFTAEYNAMGMIDAERTLAALERSGATELTLHFEVAHRESYEQEKRVIPELKESVRYWRTALQSRAEIRAIQEVAR